VTLGVTRVDATDSGGAHERATAIRAILSVCPARAEEIHIT
jgi:hypothetical protein